MKTFIQNYQNKEQLCDLLLKVWSSEKALSRIESCSQPIIIVKGKAYKLTVTNNKITIPEIHELYSKQEETDTRIIIYLEYAVKQGFKTAVVQVQTLIYSLLYFTMLIRLILLCILTQALENTESL